MGNVHFCWQLLSKLCACAALVTLLPVAGCAPERIDGAADSLHLVDYGIDGSSYAAMRNTTPNYVSETLGSSLKIEAQVVLPEKAPTTSLSAVAYGFADRADAIAEVLMGKGLESAEVASKEEISFDGSGHAEEVLYEMPDGASTFVGASEISFHDATFPDRYVGTGADAPESDCIAPFEQEELDGFSSQSAMQWVWDLIFAMGLKEDDVASVVAYALPASKMEVAKDDYVSTRLGDYQDMDEDPEGLVSQAIEEIKALDAIEYGPEDEMYSIHVHFNVNGVPLASSSDGTRYYNSLGNDSILGCYLRAYVGEEGIRWVTGQSLFRGGSDIGGSDNAVIPLDEAVNALAKRYGSVAFTEPVEIDRIALEYCAVPQLDSETGATLVPAWVFRNAGDPDYGFRVNALTAEVI